MLIINANHNFHIWDYYVLCILYIHTFSSLKPYSIRGKTINLHTCVVQMSVDKSRPSVVLNLVVVVVIMS